MKILTKVDIFIISVLLLAALLSYTLIGICASNNAPHIVEIMVDGRLYGSYRLDEISAPKIIDIKTRFGQNTLKISPDSAEMTDSNCKDRLDVKCGKISKTGQIIVCVPNRVTVRLVGKDTDKVDKVTY